MLTAANPYRFPKSILDGIRRLVEIETPTEAPSSNKLATLWWRVIAICLLPSSASQDIPAAVITSWWSSWGQDEPGIWY